MTYRTDDERKLLLEFIRWLEAKEFWIEPKPKEREATPSGKWLVEQFLENREIK